MFVEHRGYRDPIHQLARFQECWDRLQTSQRRMRDDGSHIEAAHFASHHFRAHRTLCSILFKNLEPEPLLPRTNTHRCSFCALHAEKCERCGFRCRRLVRRFLLTEQYEKMT